MEIPAANNFFGSRLIAFSYINSKKKIPESMSEPEFSPTKAPWRLRYNHQGSGQFVVESDEGMIAEICSQPNQISDANAHLISAAPKLYQALKEFLLSSEEALMKDGVGCECERCEKARQEAYRAIGFAEGKTTLKEGGPGSA